MSLRIPFILGIFVLVLFAGCAQPPARPPVVTAPRPVTVPPAAERPAPPRAAMPWIRVPITRDWKYIVVHHSASASGNAEVFDHYHRVKRGWNRGLGYHFVIGNGNGSGDGQIEVGPRWLHQVEGAHAGVAEYNQYGIGICLVGDFEGDSPTPGQIASLVSLVRELQTLCHIPSENVLMHRHVRLTSCPGRNFPYYEVLVQLLP